MQQPSSFLEILLVVIHLSPHSIFFHLSFFHLFFYYLLFLHFLVFYLSYFTILPFSLLPALSPSIFLLPMLLPSSFVIFLYVYLLFFHLSSFSLASSIFVCFKFSSIVYLLSSIIHRLRQSARGTCYVPFFCQQSVKSCPTLILGSAMHVRRSASCSPGLDLPQNVGRHYVTGFSSVEFVKKESPRAHKHFL